MLDKNIAIEFSGVGKQYRLGLVGTGSLQHDLNRWWQTSIMHREDPYLKIGDINDRSTKGKSDYVWALKDISFKVEQGDVVGIIGKNGAGKSTLLKLLSHITAPSTGTIEYRGRIASLLEVGTGFHGEMTARQNIFMNGSIMGMTRAEIKSKLDEIVDFAGIERYLDTPVKRFSSGMTVRLGFAVAAFLEPEILVVDEVLAVGDAEFQKKAIGKMKDVSQGGGRTVLFVSHNMAAVRSLCNNGIVLKNGYLDFSGTSDECVNHYLQGINTKDLGAYWEKDNMEDKDFQLTEARTVNSSGDITTSFECDEDVFFKLKICVLKPTHNLYACVRLKSLNTTDTILLSDSNDASRNLLDSFEPGEYDVTLKLPKRTLGAGSYIFYINFVNRYDYSDYDSPLDILQFELHDYSTDRGDTRDGYLSTLLEWSVD